MNWKTILFLFVGLPLFVEGTLVQHNFLKSGIPSIFIGSFHFHHWMMGILIMIVMFVMQTKTPKKELDNYDELIVWHPIFKYGVIFLILAAITDITSAFFGGTALAMQMLLPFFGLSILLFVAMDAVITKSRGNTRSRA